MIASEERQVRYEVTTSAAHSSLSPPSSKDGDSGLPERDWGKATSERKADDDICIQRHQDVIHERC